MSERRRLLPWVAQFDADALTALGLGDGVAVFTGDAGQQALRDVVSALRTRPRSAAELADVCGVSLEMA